MRFQTIVVLISFMVGCGPTARQANVEENPDCTLEDCGEEKKDLTCTYDGKVHKAGESFPATDGCNSCTCTPDGSDVTCTAMTCNKQCPEGVGWLVDAGADYPTPADSCPCEAPIEGSSCGEEGALCTYLLIYCPWQITGYEYENSLYECVDGKWASQGQDCYDCCRPPQPTIACGDASCDGNEYCLKLGLGCGTPGCSAPPPRCEALPGECFDCDCLTDALNDPTSGFADICGGTVPAICLGSYPELRIDCPGV